MPLWLVIMALGAAGCGFLFLKAREYEAAAPKRKLKQGSRTVAKAAQAVAKRPSGIPVYHTPTSEEPVSMSRDLPSKMVSEIEEILKAKAQEIE